MTTSATVLRCPHAPAVGHHRRAITAFLIAVFTYVFLANAWLGDDAYITFRVVWNLLNGYGAVFNPGERVQAYTHPLWMLLITAAHLVTREFFFTALVVSYGCALAAVLVVVGSAGRLTAGVAVFALLLSSKAFIDYTSSGLENPLTYLLLALFYVPFCARAPGPWTDGDMRRAGLIAGLAFLNRMDTILLFAPPLAWLALRGWRRHDERLRPLLVAFGLPVGAWLVIATWYYGFPLPNTYYAKVATGIPSSLLYRQGMAYVFNSFAHDPITLGTIGVAVALAFRAATALRLAAASCVLYVLYTISVGGDFMSGRFFAGAFLLAVIVVLNAIRSLPGLYAPVAAALVVYNVLMPLAPVKTTAAYDAGWPWRSQNGIKDERGHYHQITNIFFYSPFRALPDHTWMREGLSFREGPDKVTVQGSIGFYGLAAGPDKHLLDRNALSDPLLARLPVSPRLYFEFYAGHYFRDIPEGYVETLTTGRNQLLDPLLRAYYERLTEVVRGPLFSAARLRAIWALNLGADRQIAKRFESRRPVALSIRASNERFATDAGERDTVAGTIKSSGRPGYLQTGPGIPAKKGPYRARWIGTTDGAAAGALGFVDVWAGNRRLGRRDITAAEVLPERRQLAEIDFMLDQPVTDLEFRLWIDGTRSVTLERVELFSPPSNAPAPAVGGGS